MTSSSQALTYRVAPIDPLVGQKAVSRAFGVKRTTELNELMRYRSFEAGAEVISQDCATKDISVVISGKLKLSRLLSDGRLQIVGFLGNYDIVGSVFTETSYESAECVTDTVLCCFRRRKLNRILEMQSSLAYRLLVKTSHDLDNTRKWMVALGRKDAKERVAMFIYWLWEREQVAHTPDKESMTAQVVDIPFRRQDVADFLGITIETVSRSLTRLRREGVIKLLNVRQVEICDLDELMRKARLYD